MRAEKIKQEAVYLKPLRSAHINTRLGILAQLNEFVRFQQVGQLV